MSVHPTSMAIDMRASPPSGGDDFLTGGAGADTIDGLAGNDSIYGARGDDRLVGNSGNDYLQDGAIGFEDTASDSDTMFGGDGDDTIASYQGAHFQDIDLIYGGAGNDLIQLGGAQTDDRADGGTGTDTFQLQFSDSLADNVFAVLNNTGFSVVLGGVQTVFVSGMERVGFSTGSGDDSLGGGALGDTFRLHGGFDTVRAMGGDDVVSVYLRDATSVLQTLTLDGGTGNDVLDWGVQSGLADNHVFNLQSGVFTRGVCRWGRSPGSKR